MATQSTNSTQNLQQNQNAQTLYQYNYTHIPPLAMVDTLPPGENFSEAWFVLLSKVGFELLVNYITVVRGDRGNAGIEDDIKKFLYDALKDTIADSKRSERFKIYVRILTALPQILAKGMPSDASGQDNERVEKLIKALGAAAGPGFLNAYVGKILSRLRSEFQGDHISSLADYEALFPVIKLPELAHTFQEDDTFARMRVAGPNASMLRRMTTPDDRFPVTNEQYQSVMGNDDSLDNAMAEGRLYWIDYAILDGAINGTFPRYQKYLFAPIALFAVPAGTDPHRTLKPIAIQRDQTPGPDNPIITPASGKYDWLLAKALFNMADVNVHEPVAHLAHTHLLIEPFVVTTHRQLPEDHPLSLLLRPHFEGTLAINTGAQANLVAPKGGVNNLLSSSIDNDRVLIVKSFHLYGFNSNFLPDQFKRWGIDDETVFPVYPYRDDAKLIWEAIHHWVASYLKLYYTDDAAVQSDAALQRWAKELVAFEGGRVIEFGEAEGQIHTLDYLINATTMVIYTSSAQHAAVNFPQKELLRYAPAMPAAGYSPATSIGTGITEQDYLDFFPPLDQALGQLNLGYLLGAVQFTKLGQYAPDHFTDTKVREPLNAFQTQLEEIEATINARNTDRVPYPYLLPSQIPQSINI